MRTYLNCNKGKERNNSFLICLRPLSINQTPPPDTDITTTCQPPLSLSLPLPLSLLLFLLCVQECSPMLWPINGYTHVSFFSSFYLQNKPIVSFNFFRFFSEVCFTEMGDFWSSLKVIWGEGGEVNYFDLKTDWSFEEIEKTLWPLRRVWLQPFCLVIWNGQVFTCYRERRKIKREVRKVYTKKYF